LLKYSNKQIYNTTEFSNYYVIFTIRKRYSDVLGKIEYLLGNFEHTDFVIYR